MEKIKLFINKAKEEFNLTLLTFKTYEPDDRINYFYDKLFKAIENMSFESTAFNELEMEIIKSLQIETYISVNGINKLKKLKEDTETHLKIHSENPDGFWELAKRVLSNFTDKLWDITNVNFNEYKEGNIWISGIKIIIKNSKNVIKVADLVTIIDLINSICLTTRELTEESFLNPNIYNFQSNEKNIEFYIPTSKKFNIFLVDFGIVCLEWLKRFYELEIYAQKIEALNNDRMQHVVADFQGRIYKIDIEEEAKKSANQFLESGNVSIVQNAKSLDCLINLFKYILKLFQKNCNIEFLFPTHFSDNELTKSTKEYKMLLNIVEEYHSTLSLNSASPSLSIFTTN